MNKYYEDVETGIYAPTLEALKEKLVNYYFESGHQAIYSRGITYNNEIIFATNKAIEIFATIEPTIELPEDKKKRIATEFAKRLKSSNRLLKVFAKLGSQRNLEIDWREEEGITRSVKVPYLLPDVKSIKYIAEISFNIGSRELDKFMHEAQKELDEAYKNEKESFDPARDYDFGM